MAEIGWIRGTGAQLGRLVLILLAGGVGGIGGWLCRPARAAEAATPAGQTAQTGTFNTTFPERSPLSAVKSLKERLGPKEVGKDYDLSQESFVVYVPEDYDAAHPPGLLVLLNYKSSPDAPGTVLPILKRRRLIYAMPQGSVFQEPSAKVGLALDAVHNLKKRYAIDPARVYVFDFDEGGGGQMAALAFSDVFTGSFHAHGLLPWKPVKASNGGTYPPKAAAPPAKYLAAARDRPIVLAHPDQSDYNTLTDQFVQREGFRHVKLMTVTLEQAHYPEFKPEWFDEALAFLDENAARPAGAAGARPATKPGAPAAKPGAPPAKLPANGPTNSRRP